MAITSREAMPLDTARDRIVREHLPRVKKLALRLRRHLPPNVDVDDLIHAGVVGLLNAIDKFDPERHVLFSTFAEHRIRGAMLDSLRALDSAARSLRRRQRENEEAVRKLAMTLNHTPESAEIAGALGMDLQVWYKMVLEFRNVETVSASTTSNTDRVASDLPCGPEVRPDSICGHHEMYTAIHHAMDSIPPGHRRVLSMYYEKDMKMKEIGGAMGIDRSRISQIHKAALTKMRVLLQTGGIESASAF